MSQKQEKFGKYILLEKLAMGGMAEVYLAKAPSAGGISKFIAIKRILPQFSENKEFISMFKDEAKIAININHSNIVSIFEFGDERQQFYLAMDYVEGRNLRQILNKLKKSPQRLSTEQCLYIIKEVAAGLDNAHRCLDGSTGRPLNIIHRDMSPQNIMISFEGEVKIVDFGIAKAESQIETTRAGTLKGKFGYMSPEQVEGQNVDLRTDIFSLGIVLWELLANDRLFVANNEINTLRKIRDCQIPSLRKINPNIPQELDRIVNKALARDRSLRYQTSAAFHKDLNRFLNRHYPDFSSQDFSVFIKTLFATEILETRKRLIEYSKVKFNNEPQYEDDRTEVTATLTATASEPQASNGEDTVSSTKSSTEVPQNTNINFGELKVNKRDVIRKNVELNNTNPDLQLAEITGITQPSISGVTSTENFTQSNYTQNRTGTAVTALTENDIGWRSVANTKNFAIMALILSGVIYFLKPMLFPTQERELASPNEAATTQEQETFSLMVSSTPSQAAIYIDGEDTGVVTPGKVQVPQHEVFTLMIKKPEYLTFKKRYKVVTDGQNVRVPPLQREYIGYLDIDIHPRTAIIYVNGEKINQSPPIRKHPVPAGIELRVRAVNPFSSTEAERIVIVQRDSTKQVRLRLKPRRGSAQPNSGQRRRR